MTVEKIRMGDARGKTRFVELDGILVGIQSRWSAFEALWKLSFLGPDSALIGGPVNAVPALDLWAPWHYDDRIPPGPLFLQSVSRLPPDLVTVDVSVQLVYRPLDQEDPGR